MTGDRPDAAALLEEARRTLLEALLPSLPGEQRYNALMIANAMGIAAREAAADRGIQHGRLASLVGDGAVEELERRLARQIRAGSYDLPGAGRDAVRSYLRAATEERVRISNPKALGSKSGDKSGCSDA